MAVFLELETRDGAVRGDVVDPVGYEGQIRLHSIAWDYTRDWGASSFASGIVKTNGVRVSCSFGPHAVMIWKALSESHHVSATVTYDSSDDGDTPILKIILRDAQLTSCNFGMSGMGGSLDFALRFNEVSVAHVPTSMEHQDTLAHQQ